MPTKSTWDVEPGWKNGPVYVLNPGRRAVITMGHNAGDSWYIVYVLSCASNYAFVENGVKTLSAAKRKAEIATSNVERG